MVSSVVGIKIVSRKNVVNIFLNNDVRISRSVVIMKETMYILIFF